MTRRAEAALLRVTPRTLRRWQKGALPRSKLNQQHWAIYITLGPKALAELLAFEDAIERTIMFGSHSLGVQGVMHGVYAETDSNGITWVRAPLAVTDMRDPEV